MYALRRDSCLYEENIFKNIFAMLLCVAKLLCVQQVFVASVGTRNERVQQALESVLSPVVHGTVSTILGVVMLAGSEFDFVVK